MIAIFGADCDHCKASATEMSEFAYVPDLPPVVSLILGDDQEIEAFRAETVKFRGHNTQLQPFWVQPLPIQISGTQ